MARTVVCLLSCTILAACLSPAVAQQRQPLTITAVTPANRPTLAQINGGTYQLTVRFENTSDEAIILWPCLSVKIVDANDREIPKATNIGRWGFTTSPSILEGIPFVTLAAGKTHDLPVNLKRYSYDANVVTGWQLPQAGQYELQLSYEYDRAAAKKRYGKGCTTLDDAAKPWNQAVEAKQAMKVKVTVR